MDTLTTDLAPITLTQAAADALGEAIAKSDTAPSGARTGLRLYVISGGCSGFRYGMMLEDAPGSDDHVFESEGQVIFVDPSSYPLVAGSSIDYLATLMGAGFTVNNPRAVSACGCGSSFRTDDDPGKAGCCGHGH